MQEIMRPVLTTWDPPRRCWQSEYSSSFTSGLALYKSDLSAKSEVSVVWHTNRLMVPTCPQRSSPTPTKRHQSHCSMLRGAQLKGFPPHCTITICRGHKHRMFIWLQTDLRSAGVIGSECHFIGDSKNTALLMSVTSCSWESNTSVDILTAF